MFAIPSLFSLSFLSPPSPSSSSSSSSPSTTHPPSIDEMTITELEKSLFTDVECKMAPKGTVIQTLKAFIQDIQNSSSRKLVRLCMALVFWAVVPSVGGLGTFIAQKEAISIVQNFAKQPVTFAKTIANAIATYLEGSHLEDFVKYLGKVVERPALAKYILRDRIVDLLIGTHKQLTEIVGDVTAGFVNFASTRHIKRLIELNRDEAMLERAKAAESDSTTLLLVAPSTALISDYSGNRTDTAAATIVVEDVD